MTKTKIERTPYTLSAEVFAVIIKKPSSIEDITNAIFKNTRHNNQNRVWNCVNSMMKHGILLPAFKNGVIYYKYNNDFENEKKD
jgi:DNA polymerase II small subunit/DNA polymerase delta subunit B